MAIPLLGIPLVILDVLVVRSISAKEEQLAQIDLVESYMKSKE